MISINEALSITDGDIIYDFCGRTLEVTKYKVVTFNKGNPTTIDFHCIDINTSQRFIYSYTEIYKNYDDLSDEEKLFLEWLKEEKECYLKSSEELELLKNTFMGGFRYGYQYKQQRIAEEQLQK
jgi:hypothetical protein